METQTSKEKRNEEKKENTNKINLAVSESERKKRRESNRFSTKINFLAWLVEVIKPFFTKPFISLIFFVENVAQNVSLLLPGLER